MPKAPRDAAVEWPGDARFPAPRRKAVPYEFVLDALVALSPWTRPMFGCLAVYIGKKIVLILRDKPKNPADNGVWLATTREHHDSLRLDFPNMRSIPSLGEDVTSWQMLPADAPDFEEAALRACELIAAGDPRIGKIPRAKKSRAAASIRARSGGAPARPAGRRSTPRNGR